MENGRIPLYSCILVLQLSFGCGILRAATLNLWNIMFHWEVRKYRIAEMIKTVHPDLIALQEVRASEKGKHTQIAELQALLPEYKWSHFHPVNEVEQVQDSYLSGWEKEGIGVLSRHPMILTKIQPLIYNKGPDTNKRVVVHMRIGIRGMGIFNLAVVHFSYDRQQQCSNARDVLGHIERNHLRNVVILGDFNTYTDFEMPIHLLTSYKWSKKKCYADSQFRYGGPRFRDVWTSLQYSHEEGLTFSNMPTPGLESRPDRILVSTGVKVLTARLDGSGTAYRDRYYQAILRERFYRILEASQNARQGFKGYSCPHDCGPRASCRCGVCVRGGNQKTCLVPYCTECLPELYTHIQMTVILLIFCIGQLIFAMLQVMFTMNRIQQLRKSPFILCLFNPELYISLSSFTKRAKQSVIFQYCPLCYLPPGPQVLYCILCLTLAASLGYWLLGDSLRLVYAVPDEALHASDHMMLTADLFAKL
ncbi:uncharacterized protein LOC106178324 [Lingula anatina]|uniref:Uncharacterized protein LOC106178324 n=1 Tax=Lingula anatina TaxID=7574 RepID=A0A1S3K3S2_LINAN|nr:uncharacterized protein LOC106178324 [Lingula anatina]|eukprot:XP_013416911.1 uncharacterized protein LOC106178324 [Lingula anatina]